MTEPSEIWDASWRAEPWNQHSKRISRSLRALSAISASLVELTNGRLSNLEAIPADSASLNLTGIWDASLDAFVKVHITETEFYWMKAIADRDSALVPLVYASGAELAGQDLRWLVLERIPFALIPASNWQGNQWPMMAEAAARFQKAARTIDSSMAFQEGVQTVRSWLNRAHAANCPADVEPLLTTLEEDWAFVTAVCPVEVCFGDLHPGNVLCRTAAPGPGKGVLVDPIPRLQPWVFDAAYCQAIASDHDVHLPELLAKARKSLDLPTADGNDFGRSRTLTLGWTAALWWAIAPWRREQEQWVNQTREYIANAVTRD